MQKLKIENKKTAPGAGTPEADAHSLPRGYLYRTQRLYHLLVGFSSHTLEVIVLEEKKKRKKLKRANGTGTVYKLSGRRSRPWAVKKDGVYIGYYATKTSALEALSKLIGTPVSEKYNWTFAEVYSGWSKEHLKEVGPKTKETIETAYRFFFAAS